MVKALFILLLTAVVFGTAAWFTYDLYIKPEQALRAEKQRGPQPPPADPSLPDFNACVELKKKGDTAAARAALIAFIEHFPRSTKADEARDLLGEINADLFFSQQPAPEKQIYIVAKGDVLNRVSMRSMGPVMLFERKMSSGVLCVRIETRFSTSPFATM